MEAILTPGTQLDAFPTLDLMRGQDPARGGFHRPAESNADRLGLAVYLCGLAKKGRQLAFEPLEDAASALARVYRPAMRDQNGSIAASQSKLKFRAADLDARHDW
jgi:hypothetical protein